MYLQLAVLWHSACVCLNDAKGHAVSAKTSLHSIACNHYTVNLHTSLAKCGCSIHAHCKYVTAKSCGLEYHNQCEQLTKLHNGYIAWVTADMRSNVQRLAVHCW